MCIRDSLGVEDDLEGLTNSDAYLAALAALGPDAPPQTEGAAIVLSLIHI